MSVIARKCCYTRQFAQGLRAFKYLILKHFASFLIVIKLILRRCPAVLWTAATSAQILSHKERGRGGESMARGGAGEEVLQNAYRQLCQGVSQRLEIMVVAGMGVRQTLSGGLGEGLKGGRYFKRTTSVVRECFSSRLILIRVQSDSRHCACQYLRNLCRAVRCCAQLFWPCHPKAATYQSPSCSLSAGPQAHVA